MHELIDHSGSLMMFMAGGSTGFVAAPGAHPIGYGDIAAGYGLNFECPLERYPYATVDDMRQRRLRHGRIEAQAKLGLRHSLSLKVIGKLHAFNY
ncbi:MAG: hypothetical protein H6R10_719 [Rhodocyclaceae bacterium]|nr:hypothetical protein [Rhodocyclaceae bacterium]